MSLERSLLKNPELADEFRKQMRDMVDRGVGVVLSEEELNAWKGD